MKKGNRLVLQIHFLWLGQAMCLNTFAPTTFQFWFPNRWQPSKQTVHQRNGVRLTNIKLDLAKTNSSQTRGELGDFELQAGSSNYISLV
jgi:hypothetical protein